MEDWKQIVLLAVLAVLLLLAAAGCGNPNKKAIVGTWHAMDGEAVNDYGVGIEFTKDGKLRYGMTEEVFEAIGGDDAEDVMDGLDMLMSIEYEIKSDTEMKVTVKALSGLAKESETITYELKGDTLKFDGAEYTRVK